jgi:hypothetical protein
MLAGFRKKKQMRYVCVIVDYLSLLPESRILNPESFSGGATHG